MLRGLVLAMVCWSVFGCEPTRCSTPCTTGTCNTSWSSANGNYLLQEPDVAWYCNGNYYDNDCYYAYACGYCKDKCSVAGNCAYHWMYQDYDRSSTICTDPTAWQDNCYYAYKVANCRFGANRRGECLYSEQVQRYDRANHCGIDHTNRLFQSNCYYAYSSSEYCSSASDASGNCYGVFAFSNHQPARQCTGGRYDENCYYAYNIPPTTCRSVADSLKNCYSQHRRPEWGASQCFWRGYADNCYYAYVVDSQCRSVADRTGECYLGNVVPSTFYNFHCDSTVTTNCYYAYRCTCPTGPCVKGSNKCWLPSTSCPVTCANGCDEQGMCKDWNLFWDPQFAAHCAQGFWGFACQNSCPTGCAIPGCTAGGLCLGYETNLFGRPSHCRTGWGDACQNSCPAGCRNGCDNDGACIGWDLVILEGLVYANVSCNNGQWGSSCDKACPVDCMSSCMADGKCVGWWRYSGPVDVAAHCRSGTWGHACQLKCETCPGACTTRGHCAPYFRMSPRNQIASHCVISARKFGPTCKGACNAGCSACRNDGQCLESAMVPLCGMCLADVTTGCPSGVCPGFDDTVNKTLPTWCVSGHFDPACSSVCPENCLFGCTNTGACIGWVEAPLNSTKLVTHCKSGFWGKECALPCPITCNCSTGFQCQTTCTESGNCANWEKYDDESRAAHCFNGCAGPVICDARGYYGARCEFGCLENCARETVSQFSHCTGTGKCLGWNNYTNSKTDLAVHCKQDWFGPRCENMCPEKCLAGCTVQGFCSNFSLSSDVLPASHCQPNYWGASCEFRCPASCCNGCTGTGKCVGWEGRLESAFEPAVQCLTGYYGDFCRFILNSNCAQNGSTFNGNCIGTLENDQTLAVCKDNFSGIKCDRSCSGGCPTCGYCGVRQRPGSFASTCNAYAPGPPSAPTRVEVTTGNHLIYVSWDVPANNGNLTVWGYEAKVDGPAPTSTGCGQSETSPCSSLELVLQGTQNPIPNFVNLTVSVTAQNQAGVGPPAFVRSVMCFPPGPRPTDRVPANGSTTVYPPTIQLTLSGNVTLGPAPVMFRLVSRNGSPSIIGQADKVGSIPLTDATQFVFDHNHSLKERDQYVIEFNGDSVRDQDGKPGFNLNATQLLWTFLAADVTPPEILSTIPSSNSSQTLIGPASLEIVFTEPVELSPDAVVTVVYIDPTVSSPVVRQTLLSSQLSLENDKRTLKIPLSIAALHLRSARYCVLIAGGSVRDLPPFSLPFAQIVNIEGSRSWCFQTSPVVPQYMQRSRKAALFMFSLSGLTLDLGNVPAVEQLKANLVYELGVASGMSESEAIERLSVLSLTSVGSGAWEVVVDCLPSTSSAGLDASTVTSVLGALANDETSAWYTDARLLNLQLTSPNISVEAVYTTSQSASVTVDSSEGVVMRLTTGVDSGLLHVYAVVVNTRNTVLPTSLQQVVKMSADSTVLCSSFVSPPELAAALSNRRAAVINIGLVCSGELLPRKQYELVAALSARVAEDPLAPTSSTVVRTTFIVSGSFEAVTIIGGLVWALVVVLFLVNKFVFKRSTPTQVTALTQLFDLITDALYLEFLVSFELGGLAAAQALSIVIPILLNIFVVAYFLRVALKDSSFASQLHANMAVAAAAVVVSFTNPSDLGLLSSRLFHLDALSMDLPDAIIEKLSFFGCITGLLENIPQVIIVALAATELGIFDLQSQFTLAMSCMSIISLLVQAVLRLILPKHASSAKHSLEIN